jgi:tRNA(Ile)-lysidine synthase TilS/MesJ
VKNVYKTTVRDLLEKGEDVLENIAEYNAKIKESALKIKKERGEEEARKFLNEKKVKIRLLKKLREICSFLREKNPVLT